MPFSSRFPTRRAPRGFSLVELMVVILIIGLLAAILIPVIGKMRQAAFKTDTAAQLNAIRMACESYHGMFKAYPGIFGDQDIYNHSNIPSGINHSGQNYVTGTENLVLSLLGGIKLSGSNLSSVVYEPGTDADHNGGVTAGPNSLNPRNPKSYGVLMENG